jgi:hypothetical protein
LNNPRIIAQSGWFTAHRYSDSSRRFVSLENHAEIGENVFVIEIPGPEKHNALTRLDAVGVNIQSLFPDISGVCKYINWLNDAPS